MELKNTVDLMLSEDYKDRFKAEYFQLKNRHDGLVRMLDKHKEGILEFEPTTPVEVLERQALWMRVYLGTLLSRAKLENINLEEGEDNHEKV